MYPPPRKRSAAEFKTQDVELLNTGQPVSQVAQELCRSGKLIGRWRHGSLRVCLGTFFLSVGGFVGMRICAAALSALLMAHSAQAAGVSLSPVRLEVKAQGGDEFHRIAGSTAETHDQKEELVITISSVSRTPPAGLRVKWFMFGRDLKSNHVSVLRSGEAHVALGTGSQVITTPKVEEKSTPKHAVISHNSQRGRDGRVAPATVRNVAATGVKYIGYGVQVLDGKSVVAETYDPVGIKQTPGLNLEK